MFVVKIIVDCQSTPGISGILVLNIFLRYYKNKKINNMKRFKKKKVNKIKLLFFSPKHLMLKIDFAILARSLQNSKRPSCAQQISYLHSIPRTRGYQDGTREEAKVNSLLQ